MRSITKMSLLAIVAGAGLASVANADVIVSMTYHNLSGNYVSTNATSGQFNAHAVNIGGLRTSGNSSRLDSNPGDATFSSGFVSQPNPADAVFNISYAFTGVDINGFRTGHGLGSFVATDTLGNTVTGHIDGDWQEGDNGAINFNGALSTVVLDGDNFTGDRPIGSPTSWNMHLPGPSPYNGAIVQLTLQDPPNFFQTDFSNASTGTTLQILPTPGALALLGMGGLFAGRRRSR